MSLESQLDDIAAYVGRGERATKSLRIWDWDAQAVQAAHCLDLQAVPHHERTIVLLQVCEEPLGEKEFESHNDIQKCFPAAAWPDDIAYHREYNP